MDVLERSTLVLNRHWQPVHVTTVIRSLVMLWNDVRPRGRARRVSDLHLAGVGRAGGLARRALYPHGPRSAAGARGHQPDPL